MLEPVVRAEAGLAGIYWFCGGTVSDHVVGVGVRGSLLIAVMIHVYTSKYT
jgi:hypothetical protein